MEITPVEITASFLQYDANWEPSYLYFFRFTLPVPLVG